MEKTTEFRHNVMDITNIRTFANIKGGFHNGCKDVYFIRFTGVNKTLVEDVRRMDAQLSGRMREKKGAYLRMETLPKLADTEQAQAYAAVYAAWAGGGRQTVKTGGMEKSGASGGELPMAAGAALRRVLELFRKSGNANETVEKNFAVKLLFWMDGVLNRLGQAWDVRLSMKVAAQNVAKKQEYFFYYFLTLLGMDVLLLQTEADIADELEALKLSEKCPLGDFMKCAFPAYHAERPDKVDLHTEPRAEKSFEELARLASSVVFIGIHDENGDIIGSGSGIMIGRSGYILTNNHVASGGVFYSVRIEEDDNVYRTDEVIKYNPLLDLAVIRIDRALEPLPIYKGGKKLARGQKVVAIGSPLGLFNSVSDGIISGFRKFENDVDMIQFTAPISHGSSGGAVLNMYGEVIGISTAGIDAGQNINLALGYECINAFVRGFVEK